MKNIKNKNASKRAGTKVSGGSTSMQKQQHTGTQKPGVTSQEQSKSGGSFAKGGNGHMVGKQTVKAVKKS